MFPHLKISHRGIIILLLLSSALALAMAYISQYIFGLQPCQLCFWQRKPFFAIIVLSSLFLTTSALKKYQTLAIKISILLLLVNAAIAFYHSGVEQKWFKGLDSCSSISSQPNNLEELKLALEKTKAVRCDEVQFVFLKLSMASWNMLYCLWLAITSLVLVKKINQK
jgi:disulfide bond formation protein DsbB